MLPVDVRTGERHARTAQMLVRDDLAQPVEPVVPLTGITKAGDAVDQLPDGKLRIALDVEMQIDQARHQYAAGQIDDIGARSDRTPVRGLNRGNPVALHGHADAVARCGTRAVDQARVIQNDRAR